MSNPNGNIKHGNHGSLTYSRWKSMMQRCNTPSATNYRYYGARGVTVCSAWHDFQNFLSDMGECPDKSLTLDRIDNTKGYEPGNCRWATKTAQNRNRSHCVELTLNGETKILSDWAKSIGISANCLAMRINKLGWSVERALTTPSMKRGKK